MPPPPLRVYNCVAMDKKVVVAMSGGIDSSVAAILLKKHGYQCIGIHLKFWSEGNGSLKNRTESPRSACRREPSPNKCCSPESEKSARKVCRMLNIPFTVINVEKKFRFRIVDYFIDEYCAGRTPNPCVECNRHIKFGELIKIAKGLKADFTATGHYAKKTVRGLEIARDKEKDQSYFLYTLTPQKLKHILFPLGSLTKSEVRKIADKYALYDLSKKRESQNLCFFPDKFYADFLKRHLPASRLKAGPIKNASGKTIGAHKGIALYTIGQRKNLGISGQKTPLYITKIDKKTNTIFAGKESDLYSKRCSVRRLNFISAAAPKTTNIKVKIRYRAKAIQAKLKIKKSGAKPKAASVEIIFQKPQRAVAKGQSAVFYKGNLVIGGGIIS